jgi:hypothetical protein
MFGNSTKNTITQEQLDELLTPLVARIDKLETAVKKQAQQITMLEQKINDSRNKQQVHAHEDDSDEISDHSKYDSGGTTRGGGTIDDESLHATAETLYLPAPTTDGQFTEYSHSEQVGKSIYQLRTEDGINGQFIMLTTPDAIATAMISISQFVKPACRIEGKTHQLPRQIETLEEGMAQKDGNVWRVVRKAKVLFQ